MATATMTHTTRDALGRARKNVRAVVQFIASLEHVNGVGHNPTGNVSIYGRNAVELKTDNTGSISFTAEVTQDILNPAITGYRLTYHPPGEPPSKPLFFVVPSGGGRVEDHLTAEPDPDDVDGGDPDDLSIWIVDGGTP